MSPARVLIVDDELSVLNMVARALSGRGYDTEATSSSKEALEIVRTRPPFDLLVSDVIMPEICGPELAKKVTCVSPSTAVVLMSAYLPAVELPPRAGFISKPFALSDLFAIVELTLARSRKFLSDLGQACDVNADLRAQGHEAQVGEVAANLEDVFVAATRASEGRSI